MAVTTVYSAPDDGREGRPKHSELLTPNKEHKKLHLVGIYMISITKMNGPMNLKSDNHLVQGKNCMKDT